MLSLLSLEPSGRVPTPNWALTAASRLESIADPWERSQMADTLATRLAALCTAVLAIRAAAVRELVIQHRVSQAEVARHLGISKARVHQLVAATAVAVDEAVA